MTFRDTENNFDLPSETDPRGNCLLESVPEELLLVREMSFSSCFSAGYGLGLQMV